MELFIETLTGTAFELRVSPFETIMSVKAKIQRLEGIPITHQHLIWQSVELEDDYCLHDYSIHNGATLKLVLTMRGGPINTRRVPVEDSALREMAEYMEANREDILDKLPGNRHVTLLVFREGDQLNFFRVVDGGDGTLTPLSESLSASVYNFNEEEEEVDIPPREKLEENDKMKQKLDQLRLNMEKVTLTKKKVPKPPSSGRSSGSCRGTSSRLRLRQLQSASRPYSNTLNKNTVLPSVGCTFPASSSQTSCDSKGGEVAEASHHLPSSSSVYAASAASEAVCLPNKTLESSLRTDSMDKLGPPLHILSRGNDTTASAAASSADDKPGGDGKIDGEGTSSVAMPNTLLKRDLYRFSSMADSTRYLPSSTRKDKLTFESFKESFRPAASSKDKVKVAGDHSADPFKRSTSTSTKNDLALGLRDSLLRPTTTASRFGGLETSRRKEYALESLSTSEARAVSGILRQASIEKIGCSHIGNFVTSASKSRLSNYPLGVAGYQDVKGSTSEDRLMSGHLHLSANREGRTISPSHRLPPVKAKKKASKRCYVCGKKTGLATSYQCRCGNNFCATHRYAESHECTFDYKTEGRKLLEQTNPVVNAPKLPKI